VNPKGDQLIGICGSYVLRQHCMLELGRNTMDSKRNELIGVETRDPGCLHLLREIRTHVM